LLFTVILPYYSRKFNQKFLHYKYENYKSFKQSLFFTGSGKTVWAKQADGKIEIFTKCGVKPLPSGMGI